MKLKIPVAVACLLSGRAKDLSAPLYYIYSLFVFVTKCDRLQVKKSAVAAWKKN